MRVRSSSPCPSRLCEDTAEAWPALGVVKDERRAMGRLEAGIFPKPLSLERDLVAGSKYELATKPSCNPGNHQQRDMEQKIDSAGIVR